LGFPSWNITSIQKNIPEGANYNYIGYYEGR
jgi:hypothetical protein